MRRDSRGRDWFDRRLDSGPLEGFGEGFDATPAAVAVLLEQVAEAIRQRHGLPSRGEAAREPLGGGGGAQPAHPYDVPLPGM